MKKFRSAFVLYRDALVSHGDLVFDPAAPQEISVRVRLRGNALVSAAVHSAGGDAALPADALRIRGETLTFSRECFLSCACNAYAVVRLSFSRGQDARIPVYVAGPGGPPDVQRLFPLPGEADRSAAYRVRGGICFCLTAGEALGLPYDFTDADYGRTAVIKLGLPRPISIPRPRRVLIRLKGDGSYNALSLRLYNGCDASEYPLNEQYLDFEDERTLCFVLPETATLPLALCDALRLRYTPGCRKRKGELTVYEITASSEAACLPDAPPPPAYPLFAPPPPQPQPLGRSSRIGAAPTRWIRCITAAPDRSAAFACATDGAPCRMEYREAGSASPFLFAPSTRAEGFETEGDVRVPVLYHKFYLSGLKADTLYEYRLNGGAPATFRTFPAAPERFSAVILADAQIGRDAPYYARYRQILEAAAARISGPQMFISLGDMVCEADDAAEFSELISAAGPAFARFPLAPTPGNHERDDDGSFTAYRRRFALPASSAPELDGLTYWFDVGDFRFFSVCADCAELTESECAHLAELLNRCDQKWKIVLLHCSPYTGKGAEPQYRRMLAPILERGGADIVFSGHSHIYVRASVWEDKAVAPEDGILYLTMGTSGPKAFANDRAFWQDYVFGDREDERLDGGGKTDVTCAVARFSDDRVEIDVQTLSGKTIDRIALQK